MPTLTPDVLRLVKGKLEAFLKDENEAVKMYGDLISQAQNLGLTGSRGTTDVLSRVRTIRDQELNHAKVFEDLVRKIEADMARLKKAEDEKKREEERMKLQQVRERRTRYGRR